VGPRPGTEPARRSTRGQPVRTYDKPAGGHRPGDSGNGDTPTDSGRQHSTEILMVQDTWGYNL